MTDSAVSSANPNDGHQTSILTEKVARALQVRTDTVAMKAALDALQHLDTVTDSRSVRTAIEHDALQQALQLQEALKSICDTVTALRQGCTDVARTAAAVRDAVHTPVVTTETANTMLIMPGSITSSSSSRAEESKVNSEFPDESLTEEQKLAGVLRDAFSHRDLARSRLEAVHAFLEKFDLSAADSQLLAEYNFEDISPHHGDHVEQREHHEQGLAFLQAIERVRKIRLALNQTFGQDVARESTTDDRGLGASSALRMMESLSQKQEGAYERLYRWLQTYLHLFPASAAEQSYGDDQETFESDEALLSSFVQTAVYTLRHVPAFYCHTIELVAGSRRAEVTRRFLVALTAGYADAPPIEMKAHDSVAYIGDMLAFSFRAFSVEAELSKGLLHFKPATQNETEAEEESASSDLAEHPVSEYSSSEKAISADAMLSISVSGLARPLKSRVLQVVATLARRPDDDMDVESDDGDDFEEEEGTLVRTRLTHLYSIIGLLLFYSSTMGNGVQKLKSIGQSYENDGVGEGATALKDEKNPLVESLVECLSEATKAYEATIRVYGAMLDSLSVMTGDSEASLVQQILVLIAEVRMSSPGFSADVDCPANCRRTLSIDWVTQTLVETSVSKCTTLDDAVALKQSLSAAKKAGMSVTAAEKLDEAIEKKEMELIGSLVETETTQVLELCGLGSLATAWRLWKEVQESGQSMAMASYPGLSAEELESGMKEFYGSLYSPPLPSLETTIKDPLARKLARSKIADNVCDTYADLYESIERNGGYKDTSFLGHTPVQVATLFSA